MFQHLVLLTLVIFSAQTFAAAEAYDSTAIEKRYGSASLNAKLIKNAKMQGECLVGLKALNFKKADSFDAIAEWTSYRSVSLLEQYSPCEVLIMMETAKHQLERP